MKSKYLTFIGIALLGFASLCAQRKYNPKDKGIASYYSDKLHGRVMANGQKYNRDSFTCAHLKYPLGTMLKVRNLVNGKECIVRVTDRGPYSRKFIIDLSRAAAKYLGILGAGFTQVELTPYFAGKVPYRLEEPEIPEIPELDIDYEPAALYPNPVWQKDTTTTEPANQQPSNKQR